MIKGLAGFFFQITNPINILQLFDITGSARFAYQVDTNRRVRDFLLTLLYTLFLLFLNTILISVKREKQNGEGLESNNSDKPYTTRTMLLLDHLVYREQKKAEDSSAATW